MGTVVDVEQRDKLIAELAVSIRRRKLITPAIMFLEANKPFSFVAGQLLLVAEPVLGLFIEKNRTREFALLLDDRENVELLLQQLEADG